MYGCYDESIGPGSGLWGLVAGPMRSRMGPVAVAKSLEPGPIDSS